jgi:4-hydroxythreonine-4-phosphate dehydrogenase
MTPSPLLVTMGEPAGIGPELTAMAWLARRDGTSAGAPLPAFAYVGCGREFETRASACGLAVPIRRCAPEEAAEIFGDALPVIDIPLSQPVRPGRPDEANADAVIAAIETSVELVHRGRAAALVTNPIHKATLYDAGFAHPGHTEFLGELADRLWGGAHKAVMMLASDELRVVPVTVHIALSRVPQVLRADLIVETGHIVAGDLAERFAIPAPRLAVCGLNPHAGEQGAMGREDLEIIAPAIEQLRGEGIDAFGPLPADTLFHERARASYDAVLAMYHDQALIPIKTIAFDRAVNVTLGLPFVRTSPDHGTAFDIAGTGKANPASLIAAISLAGGMAGVDMAR